MLEYGSTTGLPGKYRITLAISIALLLHTLVMSVLPFTLPDKETPRRTVRVELVSPGSMPSRDTTASAGQQTPESNQAQTADEVANSRPSSRPNIVTRDVSRSGYTEPQQQSQPTPLKKEAAPPSSTQPTTSRASTTSAAGNPGKPLETTAEPVTQITRLPQETDPYLASLAARVASELNKRPVPSSRRVKAPVAMELELKLLDSGALTSAKVTRSTGFREIDRAVYQAALLASPYPEPPEEHSGKRRFRVELIFSPERL